MLLVRLLLILMASLGHGLDLTRASPVENHCDVGCGVLAGPLQVRGSKLVELLAYIQDRPQGQLKPVEYATALQTRPNHKPGLVNLENHTTQNLSSDIVQQESTYSTIVSNNL